MEKFCIDENWKTKLEPLVLNNSEVKEDAKIEEVKIDEEEKIDQSNDSNKHLLNEDDKTDSENKKIKTDKVISRILKPHPKIQVSINKR